MKALLHNGWTWFSVLAVVWYLSPPDVSGELRVCQSVQQATQAQRDGFALQANLLQQIARKQSESLQFAQQVLNQQREVIGQLELQCQVHSP